MRLITISEASEQTGISVTSLRRGVHSGRFPATRANSQAGKILFDLELLQQVLRQEAYNNIKGCSMDDEPVQEPATAPTSYLGGLFKTPTDKFEAEAERDKRLGHTPMNINKSGSFSK